MAAAKRIRDHIVQTTDFAEYYIPSVHSKTPEYFKYYIVRFREFLDDTTSTYYHLKRFFGESTNQGEILNFVVKSLEKSGILLKDEKFEKNSDRQNYLSRVYTKYHLDLTRNPDYPEFNKMIFDKFYELLYKIETKSFQEEVIFVILINTLEMYGHLRMTDSSEEIVDNEMFKFTH